MDIDSLYSFTEQDDAAREVEAAKEQIEKNKQIQKEEEEKRKQDEIKRQQRETELRLQQLKDQQKKAKEGDDEYTLSMGGKKINIGDVPTISQQDQDAEGQEWLQSSPRLKVGIDWAAIWVIVRLNLIFKKSKITESLECNLFKSII